MRQTPELMTSVMHQSDWVMSVSAGAGFIVTGIATAALWLLARKATAVHSYELDFLIVPAILLGSGLIYLIRGIFQRNRERA
jgi:hypothetical protein